MQLFLGLNVRFRSTERPDVSAAMQRSALSRKWRAFFDPPLLGGGLASPGVSLSYFLSSEMPSKPVNQTAECRLQTQVLRVEVYALCRQNSKVIVPMSLIVVTIVRKAYQDNGRIIMQV